MGRSLAEELEQMSDRELVDIHQGIGDPAYRDMVLAEERRRVADKAMKQAARSNWIAIGSLTIAVASLILSVFAAIR